MRDVGLICNWNARINSEPDSIMLVIAAAHSIRKWFKFKLLNSESACRQSMSMMSSVHGILSCLICIYFDRINLQNASPLYYRHVDQASTGLCRRDVMYVYT